jgi:ABC-type transport system involved in cytochrome bd biosynthesis fused ATPase/permease subunit
MDSNDGLVDVRAVSGLSVVCRHVPDSGVTYVDDTPLEELSRTDWLKLIAVAGQDVDLIAGTVLENIKMADIHASDEAIATALEIVGISELMESLPDGYNTWGRSTGHVFFGWSATAWRCTIPNSSF